MSVHERMESIADLYAAGGLGSDERREAEAHAADCAACATVLRDAREFAAWVKGSIAPDAPPADLEDRVVARFRAGVSTKQRRDLSRGKRILKVTASLAAAAGFVFLGNLFTTAGAIGSLKTLSSAEADFRANDRDWAHLGWHSSANASADAFTRDFAPYPPGKQNEFTYFFGRDFSQDTVVERLGEGGDRLAQRPKHRSGGGGGGGRPPEDEMDDAVTKGSERLGFQKEKAGELAKLEDESLKRALDPSFAVEAGEKASKDMKGDAPAGTPKPAPKLPDGQPEPSTLSVEKPLEAFEERRVQDARKIVRNAEATIEVDSYDAAYKKLGDLITAEKGYLAGGDIQKMPNGKIQASVTVRIPADRFDAVLGKLKELGTVKYQNIKTDDVTKSYFDLEARLKSKEVLLGRLRQILSEAKGTAKELMEVEVQIGTAQEAIDQIKGELRYYDSVVNMSTLILGLVEKDLGQPFEYVQSLQSNIALTARDPDDVYAKAQKQIVDAGGQVVDSRMNRQSDGTLTGTVRGRVDSDKFPALRESLKKLGFVTNDTVNQQKTARGGKEGAQKADAPLRKEEAIVDLTISSPPLFVTRRSQILVETPGVEGAYQAARKAVEAAGGKIADGSLTGTSDGMRATLRAQVDADKFAALVDQFKGAGKVKNANVNVVLPAGTAEGTPPLLRERAEIDLALVSPPQLIGEEHGIVKTIRDTFANSWAGLLWSIEKLFVGVSLAGPWLLLGLVGWILWKRRRKTPQPAPQK